MDSAWRGDQAMNKKDFATAITEYTTAVKGNPKGASFYLKRSECLLRLKPADPAAALLDAERAHVLASSLGRREQIGQAQLRRAHALYIWERYGDAQQCFAWAKKLLPKDKTIDIWEAKTTGVLKGLSEGDQKGVVNVKEKPELSLEKAIEQASSKPEEDAQSKISTSVTSDNTSTTSTAAGSQQQKQAGTTLSMEVQTPPSKIRHEWYQNPDTITLSLMVKGVPKDKANIDIQPGSVSISFPLPTGSDYDFSLDPLFAEIDPSKSTHKVLSTKIELSLKKSEPGRKWHSLEGTEPISTAAAPSSDLDSTVRDAVLQPPTKASAPAYPTSSKSGPKNWDKVASDLTKKSKPKASSKGKAKADDDDAEEDGKEDDESEDAYVSDDEADPVNGFFKKLYKNADPDTRRAMMKSYTESNGTALSTNWSEVGKAPVETSPPDGMVAKKWGEG